MSNPFEKPLTDAGKPIPAEGTSAMEAAAQEQQDQAEFFKGLSQTFASEAQKKAEEKIKEAKERAKKKAKKEGMEMGNELEEGEMPEGVDPGDTIFEQERAKWTMKAASSEIQSDLIDKARELEQKQLQGELDPDAFEAEMRDYIDGLVSEAPPGMVDAIDRVGEGELRQRRNNIEQKLLSREEQAAHDKTIDAMDNRLSSLVSAANTDFISNPDSLSVTMNQLADYRDQLIDKTKSGPVVLDGKEFEAGGGPLSAAEARKRYQTAQRQVAVNSIMAAYRNNGQETRKKIRKALNRKDSEGDDTITDQFEKGMNNMVKDENHREEILAEIETFEADMENRLKEKKGKIKEAANTRIQRLFNGNDVDRQKTVQMATKLHQIGTETARQKARDLQAGLMVNKEVKPTFMYSNEKQFRDHLDVLREQKNEGEVQMKVPIPEGSTKEDLKKKFKEVKKVKQIDADGDDKKERMATVVQELNDSTINIVDKKIQAVKDRIETFRNNGPVRYMKKVGPRKRDYIESREWTFKQGGETVSEKGYEGYREMLLDQGRIDPSTTAEDLRDRDTIEPIPNAITTTDEEGNVKVNQDFMKAIRNRMRDVARLDDTLQGTNKEMQFFTPSEREAISSRLKESGVEGRLALVNQMSNSLNADSPKIRQAAGQFVRELSGEDKAPVFAQAAYISKTNPASARRMLIGQRDLKEGSVGGLGENFMSQARTKVQKMYNQAGVRPPGGAVQRVARGMKALAAYDKRAPEDERMVETELTDWALMTEKMNRYLDAAYGGQNGRGGVKEVYGQMLPIPGNITVERFKNITASLAKPGVVEESGQEIFNENVFKNLSFNGQKPVINPSASGEAKYLTPENFGNELKEGNVKFVPTPEPGVYSIKLRGTQVIETESDQPYMIDLREVAEMANGKTSGKKSSQISIPRNESTLLGLGSNAPDELSGVRPDALSDEQKIRPGLVQ